MKDNYISVLEKYNVISFYHFTNIVNIDSILKNGLLNKKYMDSNGISYSYTDSKRSDSQLDCISLSLVSANKAMLYKKKNEINSEWVIIELDAKKIINDYYSNIYYCKYNASAPSTIKILNTNKDFLKTVSAFDNMFENEKPTYQAELLVSGIITTKYFKKLYVEDLSIKLLIEQLLNNNNITNVEVIVKKEMF
jgi:hypothetical protein